MKRKTILLAAAALATFALGVSIEADPARWGLKISAGSPAEARIGRPLTPGSVAGVARRTTRRVVRRSAIYVASLPRGCATVAISGASYYQCGATYYQSYGGRYVVVYID
jgi:hypothetical protein